MATSSEKNPHEAAMQPGETLRSNQVFANIVSAKQTLGDNFNIIDIIEQVGLEQINELEGAYLQRRLRQEQNIVFPADLGFDEDVLDITTVPIETAKPAEEVAKTETELDELVELAVNELIKQFERAQADGKVFSIEKAMKDYTEALGDEGVKQVLERLDTENITDLKEEVKESADTIDTSSRKPESAQMGKLGFVRFEYKDGQLFIIQQYEGRDKEQKPQPYNKFDIPKEFAKIAENKDKLKRALGGLAEIYKDTAPYEVKVMPVPKSWRRDGAIQGFEVVFSNTRETIAIPHNDYIIDEVNKIASALKAREQAGEKIDIAKEGYWQAPGFGVWKDKEKEKIRQQYVRDRIEKGMQDLGVDLDAPEPEPTEPAADDDVEIEPEEPLVKALTPADVGMDAEMAGKVREAVRQQLIAAWAKTLAGKYPRMATRGEEHVRSVAEDIIKGVDIEEAFQRALINYRDRGGSTSTGG